MGSRLQLTFLSALLVSLSAGAVQADVEGPRIRLTFVPQENLNEVVAALSPAMKTSPVAVAVEDGRSAVARDLVGGALREGVRANVRAANDVVVFALGAFVQCAGQWGLPVSQGTAGAAGEGGRGPGRLLTVRLTRFTVDENVKAVGSTYAAEVNALFRLSEGGRLVYEGVAAGTARRYGKSENEENYSEVLSDALKETYAKGLSDPGLHAAWRAAPLAGAGELVPPPAPGSRAPRDTAPSTGGTSSKGISPGDLLADLKELLRQGFTADLLVDYVDQRTLTSEMTGRDLTAWRDAGIPAEVIKAALARSPSAPPAP